MAFDLSTYSATGRLGRDAETSTSGNGTVITRFTMAVARGKDKKPTWINVTVFGNRGSAICQYLTKGKRVAISGELELREYTSERGSGQSLDVVANSIILLGDGEGGNGGGNEPTQAVRRTTPKVVDLPDEDEEPVAAVAAAPAKGKLSDLFPDE